MKFAHCIAAAALIAAGGTASAGPMFCDDFNAENGGVVNSTTLNYTRFANWVVTAGSVDLIGPGHFDFYPGNGLYVDLDGTTGVAGTIRTTTTFTPGTYDLSFTLAGSTRGDTNTVTVSLGSYSEVFTVPSNAPFATFTRVISTSGGQLQFANAGGDFSGAILDNVYVTDRVTAQATPEPASAILFGGLVAGGLALRRRKKA